MMFFKVKLDHLSILNNLELFPINTTGLSFIEVIVIVLLIEYGSLGIYL